MHDINDLAKWFLNKSSMSHKKLQKLCYYAVAWHYALYDSAIANNDIFEAWVHGPVSQKLYHAYKEHGWALLPINISKPEFDEDTDEFLEIVYNTYGDLSGHQLESLTHNEDPWKHARGDLDEFELSNEPINIETMKKYYRSIHDNTQND